MRVCGCHITLPIQPQPYFVLKAVANRRKKVCMYNVILYNMYYKTWNKLFRYRTFQFLGEEKATILASFK